MNNNGAKSKKRKPLTIDDVAQQIYQLADQIPAQLTRRDSHMLHLALGGLKYLILKGKSDLIKLQACNAVIALPMVRARLDSMGTIVEKHLHRQYSEPEDLEPRDVSRRLSRLLVGSDPADLQALEHAESQILPAKPKQTNENP